MAENGRLPESALGSVQGHKVRIDLVAQTNAMIAAAARDGITPRITQAYRSYAQQVALFLDRYTARSVGSGPYGDVRYWQGTRYVRTSGSAAAVPGTSNHGWGQAIDFATDSPGAIGWLTKNGAKYGWSRPAWTFKAPTIEPWHWEAVYTLVSNPIGGGGGSVPTVPDISSPEDITPIPEPDPIPLEDDTMQLIYITNPGDGRIFAVATYHFDQVSDMTEFAALAKIWGVPGKSTVVDGAYDVNIDEAVKIRDRVNSNIVNFAGSLKGQGLT